SRCFSPPTLVTVAQTVCPRQKLVLSVRQSSLKGEIVTGAAARASWPAQERAPHRIASQRNALAHVFKLFRVYVFIAHQLSRPHRSLAWNSPRPKTTRVRRN